MSNTRQLWYPRPPTYASVKVELNGSSRWTETFQFHRIGDVRFLTSEVTVNGGATLEFNATPGLSTIEAKLPATAATVTNGWNGGLPPGNILSSRPMRVANSPAPARTTVFASTWKAMPRRG